MKVKRLHGVSDFHVVATQVFTACSKVKRLQSFHASPKDRRFFPGVLKPELSLRSVAAALAGV